MHFPRLRLTLRVSLIIIATLSALLAFIIKPIISERNRRNYRYKYVAMATEILYAIVALEKRVPNGVDPSNWKSAVQETAIAHYNTCWCSHPPTIEELDRLRNDLDARLRRPVDIQTLLWIWDRLARTCVGGKDFTDRYKVRLDDCFQPGTLPILRPR
jgi:hypothetical protein